TFGGGISKDNGGRLTMQGSSVIGNTATGSQGGGLFLFNVTATIQDSTIAGNRTLSAANGTGGGIDLFSGVATTPTIQNSPIAFNSAASTGGGINVRAATSTLTLQSPIVSNNLSAGAANDLVRAAGTVNASTSLLMTTPAAGTLNGTNTANLVGVNPLLG